MFAPKLNSILLPQFTDTLNIYPSPLYQVSNANWSAFLKGILPTLQSHGWNNGTHGGRQLDSEDLYLLPLAVWPTGVIGHCVGIMDAQGVSLGAVFATSLPTHPPLPVPPHPTPPRPAPPHLPSHPPPLLSILTAERDGKKYLEIQPSETEKVSYNRKQ